LKAILREPLLHFAVLGLGLFALYGLVAGDADVPKEEIFVGAERVAALAEQFARARQRVPTPSEIEELIDDYVRDEVLYREGVALGLDRDDSVVRNRVRTKMELLAYESVAGVSDAELQAWLDVHPDRYAVPARYDLRQIFFDPARGTVKERDIQLALRGLERSPDVEWSALGDATLLPAALHGVTEHDVAAQFGDAFSAALAAAPTGRWFGPVTSAYGVHIVIIDGHQARRAAALADVRADVERDVRAARSDAASEAFYERLRVRYTVRLELPSDRIDGALAGDVR
jgi:hypothetical protein